MVSFTYRSNEKELLDRNDIPFKDIKRNMQELEFINRRLGGHEITLDGIVAILHDHYNFNKPLCITEIGCGGGDNLKAIERWAAHTHVPVKLTGIDINKECIAYARSQSDTIQFICSDFRDVVFTEKPHILFSSLFCHHFTDEEITAMLIWMKKNSALGFFINDLHRHPAAYYSIKWLTAIFSKSYLVKNDAPVSVKRGFIRRDWNNFFSDAGIEYFNCKWRWAFRWLVSFSHGNQNQ